MSDVPPTPDRRGRARTRHSVAEYLLARWHPPARGIGIAPALVVLFAITTASVKFSETAEAFGGQAPGSSSAQHPEQPSRVSSSTGRAPRAPTSPASCSLSSVTSSSCSWVPSLICATAIPAHSPTPSLSRRGGSHEHLSIACTPASYQSMRGRLVSSADAFRGWPRAAPGCTNAAAHRISARACRSRRSVRAA